ncbi:hypothetical protein B0H17DRAFT_1197758 [Mycena rosella]|uniref:Uncharacterized protein n=1 Tax=Mycena rosella TaxID=1033263 RepID=A0AAD7DQ38_MYCRO|nr:hypothetical protein B0H17DRAFT_1197758 [Mycena rosella]
MLLLAHGAITIYQAPGQAPLGTASASGGAAAYTGAAAYNPTTLLPPPVPSPAPPSTFTLALPSGVPPGASIAQGGDFVGFSIEMSVSNQVLGKNASLLQVPFLNPMANMAQRGGSVRVRVGGNSQESAALVAAAAIPDGKILQKNLTGVTGTMQTPPLEFSDELPYMSILGPNLIAYQAANEPDLYNAQGHRPATYGPFDYFGEFSDLLTQMGAGMDGVDPAGPARTQLLVTSNLEKISTNIIYHIHTHIHPNATTTGARPHSRDTHAGHACLTGTGA